VLAALAVVAVGVAVPAWALTHEAQAHAGHPARARTPHPAAAPASTGPSTPSARTPDPSAVPRPAHVVIVVEENHSFDELKALPFLSSLRAGGATLTHSYAITHPSQPNYLALWSGSTQGVTDDSCPQDLGRTASLGSQLLGAGLTVGGYLEGLPAAGSTTCVSGAYARKHNPLADFDATKDAKHDLPLTAFPADFSTLPTVSLVVPDLDHDMHDGSVQAGDTWLRDHLGAYATWARTHDSLLVVTADEDDRSAGNHILTIVSGQHVRAGATSSRHVTHYGLLHMIEDAYGLPRLGPPAPSITGIWR
jgi:phospholipase C